MNGALSKLTAAPVNWASVKLTLSPVNCAPAKLTRAPVKVAPLKSPPSKVAPLKAPPSKVAPLKSRSWPCQEIGAVSRRWQVMLLMNVILTYPHAYIDGRHSRGSLAKRIARPPISRVDRKKR